MTKLIVFDDNIRRAVVEPVPADMDADKKEPKEATQVMELKYCEVFKTFVPCYANCAECNLTLED